MAEDDDQVVEGVAETVARSMREGGGWMSLAELDDDGLLSEVLGLIGAYDLELLVEIATEGFVRSRAVGDGAEARTPSD
ncbi:MAG: hypothetical protein ACJ762_19505 [Solirubrobacteraceae bacterium]